MDNHFRSLRQLGVGANAKIITSEEEDLVWERGVMGSNAPLVLLHGVFFIMGINICLEVVLSTMV